MTLVIGGIEGAVWVASLIREGVETRARVRCGDVSMPNGLRTVDVMDDTAMDSLAEFRRVNVHGTLDLARQVAAAGVRRFVFTRSIKVSGEGKKLEKRFSADVIPAPLDPSDVSKKQLGQGLREIAAQTGVKMDLIRMPLVYVPGFEANSAARMRAVQGGWPLPLGALSKTAELVLGLARATGVPARLVPVPAWALRAGAALLGNGDAMQRLCSNSQVDISKTRGLLDWVPPVLVGEGLRRAVVRVQKP